MPFDERARQLVEAMEHRQAKLDNELAVNLFGVYRELTDDKRLWAALPATERTAWTQVARRAAEIVAGRFTA